MTNYGTSPSSSILVGDPRNAKTADDAAGLIKAIGSRLQISAIGTGGKPEIGKEGGLA